MNLLCCFAPGQPRLELLRHLILTGVSCPGKEFFDNLPALDARLARTVEDGPHQVVVIAPGPEDQWEFLLASRLHGPVLELIVILPGADRRQGAQRHPSNALLVSDRIHPFLLMSYLASLVALRGGLRKMDPVPPRVGPFWSTL